MANRSGHQGRGIFWLAVLVVHLSFPALAEEAARGMPAILDIIDGQWSGESGLKTARTLVDAFISHWDKHHAVLQLRNMAADQGDRRFARVRRATLGPLLERLAETVKTAQREGRLPDALHPYVTAAALAAILERLSAYHRELERSGARRGDFVETCARILHQTLDGSSER